MKRDIAIAIIAGFIIGAIVAIVVTNLPKIISGGIKFQSSKPAPTPTVIQDKNPNSTLELILNTPKDESISDTKSLEISGSTNPNVSVFIESDNDHTAVNSNDSGSFTGKINLSEGVNAIVITVYDEAGNSNTKNLNIFYTAEKL